MVRSKQAGERNGITPAKMSRHEALDIFKRIAEATRVLAWRDDRRNYMKKLSTDEATRFYESLDDRHPPDEELKARLETDMETYGAFWDVRLSTMKFFDESYNWLPECKGLVIGKEGKEPIVLIDNSVEMLILITDNLPAYSSLKFRELRHEASDCFYYSQCDIAELVPALHDDAVARVLDLLNGQEIHSLITDIAGRIGRPKFKGTETIPKIARVLARKESNQIREVGDYCVKRTGYPIHGIDKVLREHGGEIGVQVADQLIDYMKNAVSGLQKNLEFLCGGKA
jgi:hypothetical protein